MAAVRRIVSFLDANQKQCWGALSGLSQPKVGDVVPLVAHPLTNDCAGHVGEHVAIHKLCQAIPFTPPAVLCVGLNYKRHAAECNLREPEFPVLFMKNPGATLGDGCIINVPVCAQQPDQVDYEGELGFIIGKVRSPKRNIPHRAITFYFQTIFCTTLFVTIYNNKGLSRRVC
jgi:2-keto-4-pentenoate hydratase/2-oxohepta-3-ene-1,7-dioic acid hydratase in catechol pathway